MCGIVGYFGKHSAQDFLLEGLRRLEYRGYDSSGIAVLQFRAKARGKNNQEMTRLCMMKAVGKVDELEKKLSEATDGTRGIAHTRWATHGKPSEKNAHPHADCSKKIAVVHNGIIENYQELREELIRGGHTFKSETDTEVIAHLIESYGQDGLDFETAFLKTLKRLRGTYGIVALSEHNPSVMLAARMGSPLVVGVGNQEYFVASDVSALMSRTKRVVYLEDGEIAVIRSDGYVVKNAKRGVTQKKETDLEWSIEQAERGGYPHFMLKEIFEQPKSLSDALRGRLVADEGRVKLGGLREVEKRLRKINRIIIVSCGTSYHAGLVGEYMLEEYAGIPTEVEFASEFRYRKPLLDTKTAVIALSQSGETADTLAAIREAKNKGALTLGIVNTVGSTIARETDAGVYNHAGPEVSVASTKAFTSQLGILVLLTIFLGRQRNMSLVTGKRIAKELLKIPSLIETVLEQDAAIKKLAKRFIGKKKLLYLGRKYTFPIAYEGALKIKEIAYVSAQGYPTGEMKHGPIALVDADALCVCIAPVDSVYEKSLSGLEEIRARGGATLVITTIGNEGIKKHSDAVIFIPKTLEILTPFLAVIPLQLFAYYTSAELGYDVDRPRNLAKSVTVE